MVHPVDQKMQNTKSSAFGQEWEKRARLVFIAAADIGDQTLGAGIRGINLATPSFLSFS